MAQKQRTYTQNRRTAGNSTRDAHGADGTNRREDSYVYGNTVRKLDIQREMEEEPKRGLSNETRKNREKAQHMSLGYVLFLISALCCAGVVLINYIQLQADITQRMESIARLERELNNTRLANDEEYSRITSSVDLEEIKRIAIGELGMTYAKEGQIETYSNQGYDYMRKVTEE